MWSGPARRRRRFRPWQGERPTGLLSERLWTGVDTVDKAHSASWLASIKRVSQSDNTGFHPRLRHVPAAELDDETAQTSGMRRFAAISNAKVGSRRLWMGQTHVEPMTSSGDHHHGEAETAIYVVSGNPSFVFLDPHTGEEQRVDAGPGDYLFIPPFLPHREENTDPENPAVVVIARSSQEAIVVNLPSLHG